jgi:hypothetical protein
MRLGLGDQVLAAAEADFEPDLGRRRGEQRARVERPGRRQRDGEARQRLVDQKLAAGTQPAAAAAAIEEEAPARGFSRRFSGAHRAGGGAQKTDFSRSTRSVRSHEKPPSFSGLRPKWP